MGGMRTACLIECMFVVAAVSGCAQRVPDVVCLGPYEYKVQLGQGGWYVLRWESFPAQTGSNKAGVEWDCYVLDDSHECGVAVSPERIPADPCDATNADGVVLG
jgi:hypothetical protein